MYNIIYSEFYTPMLCFVFCLHYNKTDTVKLWHVQNSWLWIDTETKSKWKA